MNYLTISEIKKHCNIDALFTDDDNYLTALGNAAEQVVCRYIDQPLSLLEDDNHKIPEPLKYAMLLWIGTIYAIRESVSNANFAPVPHSFEMLCDLYKNYSLEKSNYYNDNQT